MIYRSPFLGLVTVGVVPIVGIINKFYGDLLSKNALSVQNSLADATSTAHESITCINTVITSASEEYEGAKYSRNINALYALNVRQLIAQGVYFMVVSTFLINTCVQAALLLVGSMFVEEGTLTPEVLLAFMLYQGQLQVSMINERTSYKLLWLAQTRTFFFIGIYSEPISVLFVLDKELGR
jgi:ABC-type multidrug transport system fused ATPase/permease subunit